MKNRKLLHLFFGIVLVMLGALTSLAASRTVFAYIRAGILPDLWGTGGVILDILLAAFCVWIGTNEFKRATGQEVVKTRFRWGRLLAGVCLVFFSLSSHLKPSPDALKADNDAQAAGMLVATISLVVLGVVLVAL
jgi:hypothetical protein